MAQEATPTARKAFGDALTAAMAAKGLEQKQVAVLLTTETQESVAAPSISQWARGTHEPSRDRVFALEKVLGLKGGSLSRHLGYLPVAARSVTSVADAIEADSALTEGAKAMLLAAYREAVR